MSRILCDTASRSAIHQASVLIRKQLLDLGFTEDDIQGHLRTSKFSRLTAGVYSTVTGEPSVDALRWAAHLRCGPQSYLFGLSALEVFGFGQPRREFDVGIPHGAKRVSDSWLTVVRARAQRGIKYVGDLPVESPADALIDATRDYNDDEKTMNLITDAVQKRIVRVKDLELAVAIRKIPHRRVFNETIDLLKGGQTTRLEIDANQKVFVNHGLPKGQWQAQLYSGGFSQTVDLFLADYRLVVEFDGRLGHDSTQGRFRDMDRDNRALVNGLVTLRFGWHDVQHRPCNAALQVESVLVQHGWRGSAIPCKRRYCAVLRNLG